MTGTLDERPTNEPLSALLGFTLPASKLDHPEDRYFTVLSEERPRETVRVEVEDLRPLLSSEESPKDQLNRLGYGVAKHRSKYLPDLSTKDGARNYADETCKSPVDMLYLMSRGAVDVVLGYAYVSEVLKELLGCDRVVTWNTVLRRNDPEIVEKDDRTPAEVEAAPLDTRKPLGCAHVDQSAELGPKLCGELIGQPIEEVKRVMIVNLWRPLHGPVTNAPLFVCAYPTMNHAEDVSVHAHDWGTAYDIHHSEKQKWGYIRHQTPEEVYLLKNYDSAQGQNGDALFSAHVSGDIGHQDRIQGKEMLPRESVEVRCVGVWDY